MLTKNGLTYIRCLEKLENMYLQLHDDLAQGTPGVPDLILPSLARNELVMVGTVRGQFRELARVVLPARINRAIGARETDGRVEFLVGLDDGKIYGVKPR